MERLVKERLVGAAVLMAAAIILIPEMLSGPDRGADREEGAHSAISFEPPAARGDATIKTYTIDLNRPPGAQPVTSDEGTPAPPPEDSPAPAAPQAGPPVQAADQSIGHASAPATAPVPTQAKTESATVAPPQAPLASRPAAPTSSGWAVQLGSFSSRSTAEGLMKKLRVQGHDAFVMPVKSGAKTLYRVRVGPMKDRAKAEAALRQLKAIVPAAALVVHP